MAAQMRCTRVGCELQYREEENDDGCCQYHPGPLFHDGMKEWSCCRQKSHDFRLFLELPGCAKGRHTNEKVAPASSKLPNKVKDAAIAMASTPKEKIRDKATCNRCTGGFFCSDHGNTQLSPHGAHPARVQEPAGPANGPPANSAKDQKQQQQRPPAWDVMAERTCGNAGCGLKYRELDNNDAACAHHPGTAVFHDRKRGWSCCSVFVNDFDEFLKIPPCASSWHSDESK